MARVSQEHLDARRQQILDGARRCFTRNGFHATSMQDVFRESGLSSGAVYRYFRSKDELIAAIAAEAVRTMREAYAAIAAADPPPAPDVLVSTVLARVRKMMGERDPRELAQLVVQVWGETLRNQELAETLREGYDGVRGQWVELIEAYREQGWVDRDVDAWDLARTLIGAVQGYFVQQALFGGFEPAEFEAGLRALVRMHIPELR